MTKNNTVVAPSFAGMVGGSRVSDTTYTFPYYSIAEPY